MSEQSILVAAADGKKRPVGEIWRIKAKNSDFYFDAADGREAFHLSIHGPKEGKFEGHRFHLRPPKKKYSRTAHLENQFVAHWLGNGIPFNGIKVSSDAFHVIRVRWLWDLFRERYFPAAYAGEVPELSGSVSGVAMMEPVDVGHVIDLDIHFSYGKPYWPKVGTGFHRSAPKIGIHGDGRFGPVYADRNMVLTASFVQRWPENRPNPQAMIPPRPAVNDVPNRLTGVQVGPAGPEDICWVVQSITSLRVVEESQRAWLAELASRGVAI